jgi:hypothetical protein
LLEGEYLGGCTRSIEFIIGKGTVACRPQGVVSLFVLYALLSMFLEFVPPATM